MASTPAFPPLGKRDGMRKNTFPLALGSACRGAAPAWYHGDVLAKGHPFLLQLHSYGKEATRAVHVFARHLPMR